MTLMNEFYRTLNPVAVGWYLLPWGSQEVGEREIEVASEIIGRIVQVHHMNHAEYPQLFAAADAFVLPTHGEGESGSLELRFYTIILFE